MYNWLFYNWINLFYSMLLSFTSLCSSVPCWQCSSWACVSSSKKKKATKPQHPLNKGCDSFWKLVKDKSWQSTYFCMTERSNLSLLKAGRQSLYISGAAADNIQQGSGKKILVFHVSFLPFLPWISSPQLNCGVLWALTVHECFFSSLILPFPLCFQNTS